MIITTAHIDKSGIATRNMADGVEGPTIIGQRIGKIWPLGYAGGGSATQVPLEGEKRSTGKFPAQKTGIEYFADRISLLRERNDLADQVSGLKTARDVFSAEVDRQRVTIRHQSVEIAELRKSIDDIEKADGVILDALTTERDGLRNDVRSAEAGYDEMKVAFDTAATECNEATRRAVQLEGRNSQQATMLADLQRQREVLERRAEHISAQLDEALGLIDESAPAVRFVEELAGMTEFETQVVPLSSIRDLAGGKIGEARVPRFYSDADLAKAVEALMGEGDGENPSWSYAIVDAVATALGLTRAGQ